MKKLKVFLALIPVILIALTIYLSSTVAAASSDIKTAEASSNCDFRIFLDFPETNCKCDQYFVCINGSNGYYIPAGGSFYVSLNPCVANTICVQCGTCAGSISIPASTLPCPCLGHYDGPHIQMVANSSCSCSGS